LRELRWPNSQLLDLDRQDKKSALVNSTAKSKALTPLADLNAFDRAEFIALLGPIFEHSPWIAERAAEQGPFSSIDTLHSAMCSVVRDASEDEQLALIRAHPDLVGRAVLTAESQGEQASAGLLNLSPSEVALFDRCNREYKARFGFPFVICARLNKKDAILAAFPVRLQNSPELERATALDEIYKIAALRLADLISE
jgi:2-oxo-4-hydroxy-4-carboxy-5-ureidoimidazoline decarboxylase